MRLAWLLAAALLAGAAHAEPLTFQAALSLADGNAPDVAAKAQGVEAARKAAIPAGQLPDPKLELGVEGFPVSGPDAFHPARSDFSDVKVGLMQDLPNGAKRRARVERARAGIDAATAELLIERLNVRAAAAQAWLDLYYIGKERTALDAIERRIGASLSVRPAGIASGKIMAADVTAPDEALIVLADRRADLKARETKARSELRRWIGPDSDGALAGDPPAFEVDTETLRQDLEGHPVIHHYAHMEAQAEADVAEARAEKRPDLGIELAYQHRDPRFGDMVMGGVTLSLPIFPGKRQDPMIASKVADANRIRIERQVRARSLAADLEATLADYASATDRLQRAKDASLPLAARKVQLATAGYASGTNSIVVLLDAWRDRTEAELRITELEAERAKAAARLTIYFGGDLP